MSYPKYQRARNFKYIKDTSQPIGYTGSSDGSYTPDFGDSLDISLSAQPGDIVEWGINYMTLPAGHAYIAPAVVCRSMIVRFLGLSGNALVSGATIRDDFTGSSFGSVCFEVLPSDIENNHVTIRSYLDAYPNKRVCASVESPLWIYGKNIGPVSSIKDRDMWS